MRERKIERELKVRKIEVLCTDTQHEKITSKASALGMSLSEFGLFTMLNSEISVSIGRDPALARIEAAVEMLETNRISEEEFAVIKERIISEIKK